MRLVEEPLKKELPEGPVGSDAAGGGFGLAGDGGQVAGYRSGLRAVNAAPKTTNTAIRIMLLLIADSPCGKPLTGAGSPRFRILPIAHLVKQLTRWWTSRQDET